MAMINYTRHIRTEEFYIALHYTRPQQNGRILHSDWHVGVDVGFGARGGPESPSSLCSRAGYFINSTNKSWVNACWEIEQEK